MSEEQRYTAVFFFGMTVGLLIGGLCLEPMWCAYGRGIEQRAAIERGYAEYNKMTGEWQWKQPDTKEERE